MRNHVGLTDGQVFSATGKRWQEWREIVSSIAGDHAAELRSGYGLDLWWSEVIVAQLGKPTRRHAAVKRDLEGSLRRLFVACRDAGFGKDSAILARPGPQPVDAAADSGLRVKATLKPKRKSRQSGGNAEKVHRWSDSLCKLRDHIH